MAAVSADDSGRMRLTQCRQPVHVGRHTTSKEVDCTRGHFPSGALPAREKAVEDLKSCYLSGRTQADAVNVFTSKHGCKAGAVHEARTEAAPHAGDALRGDRLADDVKGARVLLWQMLRLHELQLELALDRFRRVCDRGTAKSAVLEPSETRGPVQPPSATDSLCPSSKETGNAVAQDR